MTEPGKACECNCCEACIGGAIASAKLRALELLERWAQASNPWRKWSVAFDGERWECELSSGPMFYGATQHDAMAQAAQYIAGIL